jgi:hypothetical protein
MGLEQKFSAGIPLWRPLQGMKLNSFFRGPTNRDSLGRFRGLAALPNRTESRPLTGDSRKESPDRRYSAAADSEDLTATSEGLELAVDIMKSEIRGTISDLKRDPLKTP